jgi:hypothetical protein
MALQGDERQRLKQKATHIRKEIVRITYTCGGTHIGGSLSQTDLIVALYYRYLKLDPRNPEWEERDRFILSKGHGGVGHAAVLADVIFPSSDLMTSTRPAAVRHAPRPAQGQGVDADRFLGHGLGIGNGMPITRGCSARLAHRLPATGAERWTDLGGGDGRGLLQVGESHRPVDRTAFCIDGSGGHWRRAAEGEVRPSAEGPDIDGHDFDQI